jgi:prophage regulatory protein
MQILRMESVKSVMGHKSHASIYNAIRDGLFTRPVQIGKRSVGWPDYEVNEICKAKVAGWSDKQIEELICRLHLRRLDTQSGEA